MRVAVPEGAEMGCNQGFREMAVATVEVCGSELGGAETPQSQSVTDRTG